MLVVADAPIILRGACSNSIAMLVDFPGFRRFFGPYQAISDNYFLIGCGPHQENQHGSSLRMSASDAAFIWAVILFLVGLTFFIIFFAKLFSIDKTLKEILAQMKSGGTRPNKTLRNITLSFLTCYTLTHNVISHKQ